MRKFLLAAGVVLLALLATGSVSFLYLSYRGNALDTESKAFVDSAVPAISKNWDRKELLDRATPELIRASNPDQLKAVFNRFATLGKLISYEGSKGDANIAFFSGSGTNIGASYVAHAHFENGDAIFRLALVKRDDRWMIERLNVAPDGPIQPVMTHA